MSWDTEGNLICNICHKIVITKDNVTEKDLKENTGWTICYECPGDPGWDKDGWEDEV